MPDLPTLRVSDETMELVKEAFGSRDGYMEWLKGAVRHHVESLLLERQQAVARESAPVAVPVELS